MLDTFCQKSVQYLKLSDMVILSVQSHNCWLGFKLLALANATAVQINLKLHCLLPHYNPEWFYLSGRLLAYPGSCEKEAVNSNNKCLMVEDDLAPEKKHPFTITRTLNRFFSKTDSVAAHNYHIL